MYTSWLKNLNQHRSSLELIALLLRVVAGRNKSWWHLIIQFDFLTKATLVHNDKLCIGQWLSLCMLAKDISLILEHSPVHAIIRSTSKVEQDGGKKKKLIMNATTDQLHWSMTFLLQVRLPCLRWWEKKE